MSETATIRVNSSTLDALSKLALRRGETLTDTVDRAVKLLEQEAIGVNLAVPLRDDERDWLDADAG